QALAEKIISCDAADILIQCSKKLFYPKRLWPVIIQEVKKDNPDEISIFEKWLAQTGTVDQKAADAKELLTKIANNQYQTTHNKPNTHSSLFLKALSNRICCQPFPIFYSTLPENEQIVAPARL